jgi:hypothetical protein
VAASASSSAQYVAVTKSSRDRNLFAMCMPPGPTQGIVKFLWKNELNWRKAHSLSKIN